MRITCERGHDVCSCPDGIGWLIHAENFTDYADNQYQVKPEDYIFHIVCVIISEDIKAGKCFCGAAWAGKDHKHRFRVHTAEGWMPKFDDEA